VWARQKGALGPVGTIGEVLLVWRGGRTFGQPTKHVRTHTHKLRPLNHFTVVPQPLSRLCLNNGDPPVVEVPGAGPDETTPPGGGSSVGERHTSGGTTDAGARREWTLFRLLPPGVDPTETRPPTGAPSGTTHSEAVLSGAGTRFGVGKLPNVTTWGGGSVPSPARELASESSRRAPAGLRSAKGAPPLDHRAGTHGIGLPALGPCGRSSLGSWEGGAM